MPRTDISDIISNLATSPITSARKKENGLISAETNTDPWQPPCQTCLQKQNSNSQFVFENNTIDMNEYVKAINYINSIHNLINETLLDKSSQKHSQLNLKANIAMPDLPNFLTLLTGINNFNNAKANCPEMVSRTTSTSTLPKSCTVIDTPVEDHEEKCYVKCKEYVKEGDFEHNESKHLLDKNFEEIKGYGDQRPQSASEEELDPESFTEQLQPEPRYVPQNHECNCEHCSSSNIKRAYEKDDAISNLEEDYKQVLQSVALEQPQNIQLQRKKGVSEISNSSRVATKNKEHYSCEKKGSADGTRRRRFEPALSDAELDKYASELLVGLDWETSCDNNSAQSGETTFTFTVPVAKHVLAEKAKHVKSRVPAQPSPERRKPVTPKTKEVPLQVKQKSVTQIPVKQIPRSVSPTSSKRSTSRSCSPAKSRCSSLVRPGSATASNKKHSKTEHAPQNNGNESCTKTPSEKPEIKTFRPASSTKPKSLQLPSLTSMEKSKIAPKEQHVHTSQVQQSHHMVFSPQKKPPQHDCSVKKNTTYKVQQKEHDDFICPRKTLKTQLARKSSESVVLSDKEDQGNGTCTDSDVTHEDFKEIGNVHAKNYTFQSNGSQCNLESCARKLSRNDLEDALPKMHVSNERFIVSVPSRKKKDVRNKPFRQARRQSDDREEIFHIRNYITPSKHMNESDSNSNDSSDIKSDKEPVFKIKQSVPSITNNVSRSRDHVQHKM